MQGRANYKMEHNGVKFTYTGGRIIRNAPMLTCIGNHEVMGRFARTESLNDEFNDTMPCEVTEKLYGEKSLTDNYFNTVTYE